MKYIAIIGIALLLLATICGVVLWANMPTAKLTVHAVRPMGTNAYRVIPDGGEHVWPVWEVSITNSGRGSAVWSPALQYKTADGFRSAYGLSRPGGEMMMILAGGQHTNVYTPLPSDSSSVWAAGAWYIGTRSPLEQKLSSWMRPVPKLRSLLPNSRNHFAFGTWHQGTNVTTAR